MVISLCVPFAMLDLEDAVGTETKLSARKNVVDYLNSSVRSTKYPHQSTVVRVNCPFTTEWGFDDLDAVRY
jgi:citrate lyase beta subunit